MIATDDAVYRLPAGATVTLLAVHAPGEWGAVATSIHEPGDPITRLGTPEAPAPKAPKFWKKQCFYTLKTSFMGKKKQKLVFFRKICLHSLLFENL